MHPILFRWGDAALSTYAVLFSLAFFVGLFFWIFQIKKFSPIATDSLINIALISFGGGLVGARALFILTNWQDFANGTRSVWALWEGGMVFLGGFFGGLGAFMLALKKSKIRLSLGLATAAPALCFAHTIGRLGCLANGCCHGLPTDLPWGITFTDPLSAAHPLNIPLHPSQLYEVFGLVVLGIALLGLVRRSKDGLDEWRVVALYLGGYGLLRFIVEFTRGDTLRGSWAELSTSQWIGICLFLVSGIMVSLDFFTHRRHNSGHESRNRES